MKSLRLNQIVDKANYRIDLVQLDNGVRFTNIRNENESPHPNAVLWSVTLTGRQIREFFTQRRMVAGVVTENGEMFGIDPHNSWMLLREVEFWKECRKHNVKNWADGPWVNGKPPF